MASERAKHLAAEQKAARKAEKLRKKNSTNPADWSRLRQILEAYRMTKQYDPVVTWLMAGAAVACIIVFGVVGWFWLRPFWMWLILGVLFGLLAALSVLTWRAKNATYKRYEGQAGSAEVALGMLPKGWTSTPVIAATRQSDIVHRAVGPAGIVLVGEGEAGRVRQLLASEAKKHEQVKYGIPVTLVVMGDKPNQVPLAKLTEHIKKLPKVVKAPDVADLSVRLKALDAVRPKAPLPKGPLPTKGSRQGLRGR